MADRYTLLSTSLLLILVEFCSNFVNGKLTVRPTDAVVLVNQSTYFNCSTSRKNETASYVLWYHYHVNSPARIDVYDEGNIMPEYAGRFRIESDLSMGVFNLVVERPIQTDAGKYECQDGFGQEDKASAQLVILDGNPRCESNMTPDGVIGDNDCGLVPDDIQLICTVSSSSHGNIPTTLKWTTMSGGVKSNSPLRVCEQSTSCNLTLKGNRTFDDQALVCETMKATGQQYECSIGPVQVKYALSSGEKLDTVGDVKCYANTSQSCTYKWYNATNKEVSSDANLGKQDPGEYKCYAECEMNRPNKPCRFISMEANVVPPDPVSSAMLAVVVGSISIVIFIVLMIIIFLVLWKKDKCMFTGVTKSAQSPQQENQVLIEIPKNVNDIEIPITSTDAVDHSSDLSSLLKITDKDVAESIFDKFTINTYFIDKGTSGAIYGPFRWKDKKCALKQILFSPDKLTKELEDKITLQRNRCKELNHLHLVKILDVWFPSPALYIVMEYAEGRSLDKILRPKDAKPPLEPFPITTVHDWAMQIADGMKYLHEKLLVHRNLKAAHVLVMKTADIVPNTLKIGSYTLATEHDHSTVMSLKGTMAWMAPEYIRGEKFSMLSDVWSYGVTVWEILSRDVPFREIRKETDLVRAALKETLALKIPDQCPGPLRKLLTECWNYKVDQRPSFADICSHLTAMMKYEENCVP